MEVEFLKPWRWFKRGSITDIATGRAKYLCSLGIAAPVDSKPKAPPKPTAKPQATAQDDAEEPKPKPKRRRGRPKKN